MARSDNPETTIDFERELNPAQRDAVRSVEGAYLVVAGAGSGKTRTLIYRVAYLVLQGTPPESILLLTFTRRAAQEMLRRAAALLDDRCRRVAGGTYHSFANLILRRYATRLGYGSNFTIIDRSDAVDMIGILRTEGGYDRGERRFPRADSIVNLLSKEVNTGRPLEDLLEDEMPQFVEDREALTELRKRYAERKREQNVMDYDDLLTNLRQLLIDHESVRRKLAARYRYVMIDEYQDTNRLQAHIGALLASAHGNIMVVGDDAQSIYGFRGADFRNIIDFPQIFPQTRTILLEQNYRSSQPILDLSNAILERAREKYSKKLFTEIEGDVRPVFVRTADDYGQARFVAERVLELREEGVELGEMAVLARAAWHTNSLELELRNRNIPFRKFGGIRFVEAAHVKDVCALLKLALNPTDAGSWFRILQFFDGIGPQTARKLAGEIVESGGEIAPLTAPAITRRKYGRDLQELSELLRELSRPRLTLHERLTLVVERYREWMKTKFDDAARRMRDFETLEVIAERYDDLEAFLSDLAIDPPEFTRHGPPLDTEDEWLTLSTIHSAKGLEWHTVFLLQLNNGRFPSLGSLENPDDFEEERRLFYVAVTRAKSNLYLLKPEEVAARHGFYEVGETSPLVTELGDLSALVEEITYAPGVDGEDPAVAEGLADDSEQLLRIQKYFM